MPMRDYKTEATKKTHGNITMRGIRLFLILKRFRGFLFDNTLELEHDAPSPKVSLLLFPFIIKSIKHGHLILLYFLDHRRVAAAFIIEPRGFPDPHYNLIPIGGYS